MALLKADFLSSSFPSLTRIASLMLASWDSILLTLLIATLLFLLVKLIHLVRWKLRFQHALRDFPKHPNGSWFMGDIPEYTKGHNGMAREFHFDYEEVDDVMQFWLGPFMPGVVVFNPDTVKSIANKNEPKQESVMRFLREWIGDGLVASSGEHWARNRRLVAPAFHYSGLRPHVSIFSECAHTLVNKWKKLCQGEQTTVNVYDHMGLLTLDNLLKSIYSYDSHCQTKGCTYVHAVRKLANLFFKRFVTMWQYIDFLYYKSPDGKNFRKFLKVALDFSRQVIVKRQAKRGQERVFRDLLDILIDARDDDGQGLSEEEIQNEVNTFMFGGYETTSTAATWAIYCLAQYPDYQDICRKEVDDLMNAKGTDELDWTEAEAMASKRAMKEAVQKGLIKHTVGPLTPVVVNELTDMSSLPFLTMCIKESQRLYPTVPFVFRRLTEPLVLSDGRVIPTDTTVYISMSGLHLNPTVWDSPQVFSPERFSPENCVNRSPHAFLPFSAGPRNCLGQQFAVFELKTTFALLLRHFVFEADESKKIKLVNAGTLRSETGIHVLMKPRKLDGKAA